MSDAAGKKKKMKKPPIPKTNGRPTDYRKVYDEQARKLCLLGATHEELANFFGVTTVTFYAWLKKHKDFLNAIRAGKEFADANVASRLYERAMGYSHQAVKIVADAKTGAEHIVPYTENYPPDTAACIFWMKNRRKDKWRDTHTHAGDPENPVKIEVTNREAESFVARQEAAAQRLATDRSN